MPAECGLDLRHNLPDNESRVGRTRYLVRRAILPCYCKEHANERIPMDEIDLVCRAILSGCTGDCEWDEAAARRVAEQLGLDPMAIRHALRDFVTQEGRSVIERRKEIREDPGWSERQGRRCEPDWWYRIILPVPQFRRGLFIEIILMDADPQDPQVLIVNAHEERS